MHASLVQKKRKTHLRMNVQNLKIFKHSSMYLCERESNAFRKSMSRIRDSIFFLLLCFRMLMMQDPIRLPGIYAFCCCPITLPTSGWSLWVRQHACIGLRGAKFPVGVEFFCPFLSRSMMPVFRGEVRDLSLYHSLKALNVTSLRLSQNFLNQLAAYCSLLKVVSHKWW